MQALMWDEVGILRHGAGLEHARAALRSVAGARPGDGVDLHETANLALVGWVMIEAALRRQESRGAHHRLDFPEPRASWRRRQSFVLPSLSSRRGPAFGEAPAGAEVHS
jgi:L-aspartate oxidase